MTICVYGMGHLGIVTAACLAADGHYVYGLGSTDELDQATEPGLATLVNNGIALDHLILTDDADEALSKSNVLWINFDTPTEIGTHRPIPAFLMDKIDSIRQYVQPETLVIVSSQVPVGFTKRLADWWHQYDSSIEIVCMPENLRRGYAVADFQHPSRTVIGFDSVTSPSHLAQVLRPDTKLFCMSFESAEMSKHATNSFLATCIIFAQEISSLCTASGATYEHVEQVLRADERIGTRAYLSDRVVDKPDHFLRELRNISDLGDAQSTFPSLLTRVGILLKKQDRNV